MGRKNGLVFASSKGGDVGCRLFSPVLSAMLAGFDVESRLEDVLGRLETTPASKIATLLPGPWAVAPQD